MLCLTLMDPWATLVKVGAKTIETRSWATAYRGLLYIHSSKRFARDDIEIALYTPSIRSALADAGVQRLADLPRGAIVARCQLVDCRRITEPPDEPEASFGDYSPGRWAWILEDVTALPEPISARGSLGLWSYRPAAAVMPAASVIRQAT